MNNGEQMNEFLDQLIASPHANENQRLLARRMRNDEDFHFDFLMFTTILSIRFPELFLGLKLQILMSVEDENPERKS